MSKTSRHASALSSTHEHSLLDVFDELSFAEKWRRVLHGWRQPAHSGERRWAQLQTKRLMAPFAAVLVPCVVVTILLLYAPAELRHAIIEVEYRDPTPIDPLDKKFEDPLDIPEPVEPVDVIDMEHTSVGSAGPAIGPPAKIAMPQPIDFVPVQLTRSRVVLKGVLQSRTPGGRAAARAQHGGSEKAEAAVMRVLRWLKTTQEADGSWSHGSVRPAMTAFALLTYLAHGETPASEEFGETVEKSLKYLTDSFRNDHFKGRDGHDYTHPICAYALSEAYAMTGTPLVKVVAEQAITRVVYGQHKSGGWDYGLKQTERDDTSYMGWCAQALKAAQFADLEVDGIDRAAKLAIRGFQKNAHPEGGFGYTGPGTGGLTGVGVLSMQLLGGAGTEEVREGLAWMESMTCDWEKPFGARPIYYWYYATQAKFHAGDRTWKAWNREFSLTMLKNQVVIEDAYEWNGEAHDIGYWESPSEGEGNGLVYSSTLCGLMLQVYHRGLGTFAEPEEIDVVEISLTDDPDEIKIEIL